MKSFIIAAVLIAIALTTVNAQYTRTAIYKDAGCNTTPAYLDMYVKNDACVGNTIVANCSTEAVPGMYTTLSCTTTVPSTGPKKTLLLNVYSDNTCAANGIQTSQIIPLDTCVTVPSAGSVMSTGCKTMTLYSDSACKTVKTTVDYAAFNGVCNSGTKYICSDSRKIGMSAIAIMIIASLLSIIF